MFELANILKACARGFELGGSLAREGDLWLSSQACSRHADVFFLELGWSLWRVKVVGGWALKLVEGTRARLRSWDLLRVKVASG